MRGLDKPEIDCKVRIFSVPLLCNNKAIVYMEYQDIYDVIKAHNGGKFKVTYSTGNVEVKRLFISTCNDICEFSYR